MGKVLVTGGAGYIGSHAVKVLLRKGYEVVVVDNLVTGHRDAVDKNALFYQGDIADDALMTKVFTENEIVGVIHFAAFSLVGESMINPYKYYENNVGKTNKLLRTMVNHGVNNLIFSSTAATYGEPEKTPIVETDRQEPTSVYGQTKLAMEHMIGWYGKAHGLKSVALRYFNVAGALEDGFIGEDHNPETHLIPIILQVANGKRTSIGVFGDDYPTRDGTCIRDYIHVLDLCEAHVLALEYLLDGHESENFNLGSGEGFTVLEMIEAARKVTGQPIPLQIVERRAGDPAILIASSSKAKEKLGWNPTRENIETMIKDAWNWHQKHPNGYNDKTQN